MQENRGRHTGRYEPTYERGYRASMSNTYFGKPGQMAGLMESLRVYGTSHPTKLSVDDFTRHMSSRATAAFEDGWFDALEDNMTCEEYFG